MPDATTILGAAKITGRTSRGYTLGLLNAVTGRATAESDSEPERGANKQSSRWPTISSAE